ncbi:unnamed protein product [Tuber melanosporum]|uniref:(Perigord truffle) hypothetical protein n=1 Tax=Tuber melanosporum (strain Mel28) TaxID=656061 RepID=D5G6L4_TUBMM|nr:uncharacterized protein GSTUM_00002094001 [Tuber melanosporum]CAZ80157.1 unnamed protein product [Tuber melanosporum]
MPVLLSGSYVASQIPTRVSYLTRSPQFRFPPTSGGRPWSLQPGNCGDRLRVRMTVKSASG